MNFPTKEAKPKGKMENKKNYFVWNEQHIYKLFDP